MTHPIDAGGVAVSITRTLQRGLQVLEALATRSSDDGAAITDVAAATGLDKATVLRLLQTLVAESYAHQDPETRRYKLTGKLLSLGNIYRRSLDLPRRAASFLAALREATDETVHLGVRDKDSVVYIAKLDSHRPVQIASAIGQSMPLHTTALGKAIMAAMPEDEREALIATLDLAPRTESSIRDDEALRADLAGVIERGYSIDDRENEDAIICVGAAIVERIGDVAGAISVSGPSYRVETRVQELGERCRKTASEIGAVL